MQKKIDWLVKDLEEETGLLIFKVIFQSTRSRFTINITQNHQNVQLYAFIYLFFFEGIKSFIDYTW